MRAAACLDLREDVFPFFSPADSVADQEYSGELACTMRSLICKGLRWGRFTETENHEYSCYIVSRSVSQRESCTTRLQKQIPRDLCKNTMVGANIRMASRMELPVGPDKSNVYDASGVPSSESTMSRLSGIGPKQYI